MKKFSLIFLMCFSVGLQGASPASAQKYANSSQAEVNSAVDQLQSYNESLNGTYVSNSWSGGVLSQIETILCGSSVSLDSTGNVTTNGLNFSCTTNTDGTQNCSYSNCNGGIMAAYNQWSKAVTNWQISINNLTNSSQWEYAYDACAADTPNFYDDIQVINNNATTSINNQLIQIVGADATASSSAVTGLLTTASGLINNMNAALTQINGDLNTSSATSVVTQIINQTKAIVNSQTTLNTSYSNYVACYNSNLECTKGKCSEKCYTGWNTTYEPAPCSTFLQTWLTDFETFTTMNEQLFSLLLNYQPYDTATYSIRMIPAPTIGCILPKSCIYEGNNHYNCLYKMPQLSGDFSDYINNITTNLKTIKSVYGTYTPILNSANSRVSAIYNQLQLLVKNIKNITDNQIPAIIAQCTTDTNNYIAAIEKRNAIAEVFAMVIGNLIALPLIEVSGGLSELLPQLLMVLMMVPEVNNATIGKAANILSQDIANKIINVNG